MSRRCRSTNDHRKDRDMTDDGRGMDRMAHLVAALARRIHRSPLKLPDRTRVVMARMQALGEVRPGSALARLPRRIGRPAPPGGAAIAGSGAPSMPERAPQKARG